jgi:hypothetical protein
MKILYWSGDICRDLQWKVSARARLERATYC